MTVGGGCPAGWFVEPTVCADVDSNTIAVQEEIFGPVLSGIAYEDEADAIRIANDTDYGLGCTVWTTDRERGIAVAERIRSGNVGANRFQPDPVAPFGGIKASGVGRELGPDRSATRCRCPRPPPCTENPMMTPSTPTAVTDRGGTRTSAPSRTGPFVAILAFGGIVFSLMQTLVIPILPQLPDLLDTSASNTSWAVTATLLASAVATPVVGRLADMFGKRRMLLVSIAMLVAGSVVAALSESLVPLVVGRALQGLAAGMIPLGISIMRDELPPERLGSATALMSASLGVGGALGLPAAAAVAENFDWHVLFWASGVVGALAGVLVLLFLPDSKIRSGGRFDVIGAVGMAAGLISLLLAISKGDDWGWGSGTTLGLFAAAVVILVVWGVYELHVSEPLVNLRLTARRQVLFTNLASIAIGVGTFTMMLVFPQLLQLPEATGYGLGTSLTTAGLVTAPTGLVMIATAPLSAAVSRARGPRTTLMIGAFIVAVGYGLGILLMSEIWHFVLVSSIIGAGIGFNAGAMPTLIMGAVPASETGAANSLNTLMRSLGSSTASAVVAVILAQMITPFQGAALPSENGFKTALAVAAGSALLAVVLAFFVPRRHSAAGDAPAETSDSPRRRGRGAG
ncbi:MFS transporter [Streptomyces sp. WM6386]|uniref:MFS transporter n=1 Tax=Streptomyces sp. WM6386 TaxID=1415558 RepID=UPI001F211C69|nr:MFS transporter [Streptomyces sp. WM6386]